MFRTVWDEFYSREKVARKRVLKGLERRVLAESHSRVVLPARRTSHPMRDAAAFDKNTGDTMYTSNQDCAFEVCEYRDGDPSTPGTRTRSTLPVENWVAAASSQAAYAPYESTTPSSRNIFQGDDPDDMAFLPFPDDPSFNAVAHQECYATLSWQDQVDPDLYVIVLATAKRLHQEYNLSAGQIDFTDALPIPLLSTPGRRGVLQTGLFGDYTDGIFDLTSCKQLFANVPGFEELYSRISSTLGYFCPNLNCIEPCCPTHHSTENYTMPPDIVPQILNADLQARTTKACGQDCYLNLTDSSPVSVVWDESSLNDLTAILRLTPDSLPCDIAVICRKPCSEVFLQRQSFLPDKKISATRLANLGFYAEEEPSVIRKPPLSSPLGGPSSQSEGNSAPPVTCLHAGSCTEYIKASNGSNVKHCICALSKRYCDRNCRCPPECELRWSGCKCASRGGSCSTITTLGSCPCIREGRECDPELCVKCEAKDVSKNICQNAQIQQGRRKRLTVKASRSGYGLGAFLMEPAKCGDLIGEYIGEIIFEPTAESRADIAEHRGRNYVYGLGEESLDSSYVGNETRYINHSTTHANCKAPRLLVNGEYRIGIYATEFLPPRTELLLDYGPLFFDS